MSAEPPIPVTLEMMIADVIRRINVRSVRPWETLSVQQRAEWLEEAMQIIDVVRAHPTHAEANRRAMIDTLDAAIRLHHPELRAKRSNAGAILASYEEAMAEVMKLYPSPDRADHFEDKLDMLSLVEKLEAEKRTIFTHPCAVSLSDMAINHVFDRAISIVRELAEGLGGYSEKPLQPDKLAPGEICVVDEEQLKYGIVDRLGRTFGRSHHEQAEVILTALRPYLRTTEPNTFEYQGFDSLSPREKAIYLKAYDRGLADGAPEPVSVLDVQRRIDIQTGQYCRGELAMEELLKAAFDAAGVKYVE